MHRSQRTLIRGGRAGLALALAGLLAGCPAAPPKATVKKKTSLANYPSAKPLETRKVQLKALTVDISRGKGAVVGVSLTVGPNRPGRVDVTVSESLAGGTGDTLRSSLWKAAFAASTLVGRSLIKYSIALGCDGAVDGSSMGVLLTAAIMAAMVGSEIQPGVSLTGSMLPDGSVGPVGGLPQKLTAAFEAGIKTVGYPLGQRQARDMVTGQMVDIEKFAADHGARAVELATVHDAFTLLTGKSYPRPEPLPAAEMAMTQPMIERTIKAAEQALASTRKLLDETGKPPARTPKEVLEQHKATRELLDKAQQKLPKQAASALVMAQRCRGMAYLTNQLIKHRGLMAKPDEKALVAQIGELRNLVNEVVKEVRDRRYSYQHSFTESHWNVVSYQRLMGAFLTGLTAAKQTGSSITMLRVSQGKPPLPTPPGGHLAKDAEKVAAINKSAAKADKKEIKKQLPELLRAALGYKALTWSLLQIARDYGQLDLKGPETAANQTPQINEMTLEDASKAYTQAARANLVYYESVIKALVVGRQMPRQELVLHSHMASLAAGTWAIPDQIVAPRWGATTASTAMIRLAGAKESWLESALLIYRSFYPTMQNKRAREGILKRGDKIVRRYSRVAKKLTGTVPMSARLFYQAAVEFYRDGDETTALEWAWRAALESDFSILLARVLKKSTKKLPTKKDPARPYMPITAWRPWY